MNRSFYICFWLLLLCSQVAHGQRRNDQWRFGFGFSVGLSGSVPSALPSCLLSTGEGSASVADEVTGRLLFYTDGVTIWDSTNVPMPNGTGLFGGTSLLLSSTSAAVIVPKPFTPGIYYVITIDEQSSNNGMRYSVVDMALNGGKGDVVAGQKNILILNTTSEKLQVVPQANQLGYWLLTHDCPGNTFYAYSITQTGINLTPVTSTLGATQGNGAGHMKVNRQFNKLAMGNFFSQSIELFDFDNATGLLSNFQTWAFQNPGILVYGVEFSPNGSKLYASDLNGLYQYDLLQPTPALIAASEYSLGSGQQFASLQLRNDGYIYFLGPSFNRILCPDLPGPGLVIDNLPSLGGSIAGGYGLPQWIYVPTDTPLATNAIAPFSIKFADTCIGDSTLLGIITTFVFDSVRWSFGDPNSTVNTGTGYQLKHRYGSVGSYTVSLTVYSGCNSASTTQIVIIDSCNVAPQPIFDALSGIGIYGDSCRLGAQMTFLPVGATTATRLFWEINGTDTFTQAVTTPYTPIYRSFLKEGQNLICVTWKPLNEPEKQFCQAFHIGNCCNYQVTISDSCLENDMLFSVVPTPDSVQWRIRASSGGLDTALSGNNRILKFSAPTRLLVQAIATGGCGIDTVSKIVNINSCLVEECLFWVPNAFSPNGDGLNENIRPTWNCQPERYEWSVFNRWGQQVFESTNPLEAWDGGKLVQGIYYYKASYAVGAEGEKVKYGFIQLFR